MKKSSRVFMILVIALIISAATYAFAAANTVPATNAGDGSGQITGYTVNNIQYILDATDPSLISQVRFQLAPATATSVHIRLVTSSSTWYNCTLAAGTYTCNIGGAVTALAADQLRVVAAQ